MGCAVGKHVEEMVDALKKPKLSATPFSLKVAQFCSAVVDLLKMGSSTEQKIAQVSSAQYDRVFAYKPLPGDPLFLKL